MSRSSWLRAFLSSYRRPVAFALLFGVIASAFSALLMFASGFLISATAQVGVTLFAIMLPIAFVQLFGIGRPFARYIERLISHGWVLKVTSDLRRKLYRHIVAESADPTTARQSGDYLGLLADDIDHLQNLYLRVVFPTTVSLLLAIGAAIAFGFFSVAFGLTMLLVFAGVTVGLPIASLAASRMRSQRAKAAKSRIYASLTDDVLGSRDLILSGRSSDVMARHADEEMALLKLESDLRMSDRVFELVSLLALAGVECAVIVWAGQSFGSDSSTSNWIAAFALGFFPLIESFAVLPATVSGTTRYLESVDNLKGIAEHSRMTFSGESLPQVEGPASIDVIGVTFGYPGAQGVALDDIDVRIDAGQHVAVLGRSGAGKSTLASLVRGRLAPDSGRIVVGGVEVRAGEQDLSGVIGFLSQNPYLFNKTLRDNLKLSATGASDKELVALLDSVGLTARFDRLADGLDTVIGETGEGFSGGEAHRIALARVLAADVSAVIVDEPFAALDPVTEESLLETLLESCADRTLVVITHHLARIERFDRVIFLEDGKVKIDGNPSELLQSDEWFRKLVEFDANA